MGNYVLVDVDSHEHLVKFDHRNPAGSSWKFLDTDIHPKKEGPQVFDGMEMARGVAERVLKAESAAQTGTYGTIEIREVVPALMEEGRRVRVGD
jgi:hypothetical protein